MSAAGEPAESLDRRIAHRRQPTLGTVCFLDLGHEHPTLGLVWNISTSGVSMLVNESPKAGAVLQGKLRTMTGDHFLLVNLKVVHIRKIETGDFLLGAQFDHTLDPHDLDPFVA